MRDLWWSLLVYKELNLPFNLDGNLHSEKKTYTVSYWFYIGYAYRGDVWNS